MTITIPPFRYAVSVNQTGKRLQYLGDDGEYHFVETELIQEPPYTGEEVPSDE